VTANAESNDEWVGVDDIAVIGDDIVVTPPPEDWKQEAEKPFKPARASKASAK
jgi:hypothetical protein